MRKALSLILAVVMVALMIPFAALMTSANGNVANSEYAYYADFVAAANDDGKDGDINPHLPAGTWATKDTQSNRWTSLIDSGLRLGGQNQGMGLTADAFSAENQGIVNGTTDHIIEFTWNCNGGEIQYLRFGWNTTPASYNNGTLTNATFPADHLSVEVKAGTGLAAGKERATGLLYSQGAYNGVVTWGDENGTAYGLTHHMDIFANVVANGADVTMSIVVKSGKVAEIHMTRHGDEIATFYPHGGDVSAKGYFTIWHTGWGDNKQFQIKNIAVKALGDGEGYTAPIAPTWNTSATAPATRTLTPIYSADFSQINSDAELAAAGWKNIYQNDDLNNLSYVEDGLDYRLVDAHNLVLETVKFSASKNYVVEYDFQWNSSAWILTPEFGHKDTTTWITEDANGYKGAAIKMRGQAPTAYYSDLKGSINFRCDNLKYYADADMTEAIGIAYKEDLAAMKAGATVTMKIIIEAGSVTVVEMTVGENTYFLKPTSAIAVPDGNMFGLTHIGAASSDRAIVFESFKVYETAAVAYTGAEVVVDGVSAFLPAGTEYDMTAVEDVIAVKVDGVYSAPTTVTLEAGKKYEVFTKNVLLAACSASLRDEEGTTAIRFATKFAAADLQTLVDLYEAGIVSKVEVGTLITTTPWAEAAGEVTHAALDDIANGKTAYIEVEATINQWYATNTFAGSVITSNVDREYQAVGFINVELANGANLVVYSAVTASDLATLTPEEA